MLTRKLACTAFLLAATAVAPAAAHADPAERGIDVWGMERRWAYDAQMVSGDAYVNDMGITTQALVITYNGHAAGGSSGQRAQQGELGDQAVLALAGSDDPPVGL
jgi:hypothetical protein